MQNSFKITVLAIALVALISSFSAIRSNTSESASDMVINRGQIRVGYIIYPPLLEKDPRTGDLSGISYDIIEAVAEKLNIQTNWVEEVGWGSAIEGLKTGRYHILGTQMWPNSSRAREAVFSNAPFNSVIYAYAREDDRRFDDNLGLINSEDVTISLVDGEMAMFIAQQDFPLASLANLPQLSSYAEVVLQVINNRADIILLEPSVVNDFNERNENTVRRISENPIRSFGNSFAFARGEESMVSMWNIALTELIQEGVIQDILEKHNVIDFYEVND